MKSQQDGSGTQERPYRQLLADVRSEKGLDGALTKARKAAEKICKDLLKRSDIKQLDILIGQVGKLTVDDSETKVLRVPELVIAELRVIQQYGNLRSHDQDDWSKSHQGPKHRVAALNALETVVDWIEPICANSDGGGSEEKGEEVEVQPEKWALEAELLKEAVCETKAVVPSVAAAQKFAALVAQRVYALEKKTKPPAEADLEWLLMELSRLNAVRRDVLPQKYKVKLEALSECGQRADDPERMNGLTSDDRQDCVRNVQAVFDWFRRDRLQAKRSARWIMRLLVSCATIGLGLGLWYFGYWAGSTDRPVDLCEDGIAAVDRALLDEQSDELNGADAIAPTDAYSLDYPLDKGAGGQAALEGRFVGIPTSEGAQFWMQETEATVEQALACVAAGGCDAGAGVRARVQAGNLPELCTLDADSDPRLPINCLTAEEAEKLCAWLGRAAGFAHGRLPKAREWEIAAEWTKQRSWLWGREGARHKCDPNLCDQSFLERYPSDPACSTENANATECDDDHVGPAPVGTREPRTSLGLEDVLGNVAEFATVGRRKYALMGRGFRNSVTYKSAAKLDGEVGASYRSSLAGVRCVALEKSD